MEPMNNSVESLKKLINTLTDASQLAEKRNQLALDMLDYSLKELDRIRKTLQEVSDAHR